MPGKINSEFDKNKSVLGELFFNSKVLSFNSDMSCSTCHLAEFSSADGLPNAVGVGGHGKGRRRALSQGQIVPRNTLPLWGRSAKGFNTFFWDGKVRSIGDKIESQFGKAVPSGDPLDVAISLPFVELREMVELNDYVNTYLLQKSRSSGSCSKSISQKNTGR